MLSKIFRFGIDDELAIQGLEPGGPQLDPLDGAELVVGLDQLAAGHRALDGHGDPGDEVGGHVLKREAQGEADDAGTGQEGGRGLLKLEHVERDEKPGDHHADADQLADQLVECSLIRDPSHDPAYRVGGQKRGDPGHEKDRKGHPEVGQQQDQLIAPDCQLPGQIVEHGHQHACGARAPVA